MSICNVFLFFLLGLVTNDVLTHLKKRKSRRQRRHRHRASSTYNNFHNNMWDLTVVSKIKNL